MTHDSSHTLLRIRPSLPDQDEVSASRGPLMMETVLSSLHSLSGKEGVIDLEIGLAEGKIGLFARCDTAAAGLVESQLYAQFPDAEIECAPVGLFEALDGEVVIGAHLSLTDPEIFPIKRYPQFTDVGTKQSIDTIAGLTSTLVRYVQPGMRGHIQVSIAPLSGKYRKRALRFLPYLQRGISKHIPSYALLWTKAHLARGWRRAAYLPIDLLLGGFRVWFSPFKPRISVSLMTGETINNQDDADAQRIGMRTHDREDAVTGAVDKLNRLLFSVSITIRVITPAQYRQEAETKVREIVGSFRQFSLPQSNGFSMGPLVPSASALASGRPAFTLSAEEIATLWHVPNILVKTPNIDWVIAKKLEPPVNLPIPGVTHPPEQLTVLGESLFHGQRLRCGIQADDRRRHMYVIGKTGMGKSTILENMIYADIISGQGVGVIDPHGDLIEAILRFVPKNRSNDVILFDPSDRDFPVSFNMLECVHPDQRPLICSGLMSVFTKLWPDAFSGRMEHILRNTLLALLENEGSSMLGILRMFGDDPYRKKIVANITDPMVKSFWESEYAGWTDKYRTEAVAAIQNKIGQLLTTPLIRNIVGQVKSTLDVRFAMDTGKIVLVNLSKGKLGEDTSAFLGSMLVTKFQIDAMSRADIPEHERKDFQLYVDEFQNFATKSFATILSEARKYRLSLTMAHQYVGQLIIGGNDTSLRDAVFGNVGSMVSFQVGSDDAEILSLQFEEMVQPKDILSLPKYHAYIRLMINGVPSKPFSLATLPPPRIEQDSHRVEIIRNLSRERYAQGRAGVEEKILRWASTGSEAKVIARQSEKLKEKSDEETKKARAKKMTLEQYRAWRDREMWLNEYNALRKKSLLGEALSLTEEGKMQELAPKLEATGGIPPPSKTLLDARLKREGGAAQAAEAAA